MSSSDDEYLTPTPFVCEYCDKSFTSQKGCSVHISRQHVQYNLSTCFSTNTSSNKDKRTQSSIVENAMEDSNLSLSNIFYVQDNRSLIYDLPVPVRSNSDLTNICFDIDEPEYSYSELEDTFKSRVSNEELKFAELCCKYELSNEAAEAWRKFSGKDIRTWDTIKKNLQKEYNDLDPDNGCYLSTNGF